ncbi:MAG: pilus assembly protein TadG-related protein, partial [Rhodospirillales bacterium]|nr:pilus assembly protein TadG-related protein [Rhodospirillales bacterium]
MATVMMQRTKQPLSTDRFAGFVRDFRSFLGDQAGASFVITALTFPVILGLAGLGLDATMWYQDKRQNQTIVDNAAVAGTIALSRDAALTQSALET